VAAIHGGLAFALLSCGDEPTGAPVPLVVEASLAGDPASTVGTLVDPAPTFVVRNASGRTLANLPIVVSITRGKGTLTNVPTRTGSGPTPIGDWTLDTIAGPNAVTIAAPNAPPVVITLTGTPDEPVRIEIVGADQLGLAGEELGEPVFVHVVDEYGNRIPGVDVTLSIVEGGGSVNPHEIRTTTSTGANGVSWTLGNKGGHQRIVALASGLSASIDASIRSDFSPDIRFAGPQPSAAFTAAVEMAADRVRAIVTGDIPPVPVHNFDMSRCGVQGATVSATIDDIMIFALVAPLDGTGNVIASAGPCVTRTLSHLPVIGVMRFDAADVAELEATGQLNAVVLHEMLHVVGVGTIWRTRDLVFGLGGPNPRFQGPRAAVECIAAGGSVHCADQRVPVEETGGSGTANAHWRESVFDTELMTGFLEESGELPLSRITVASLEDIGFSVNLFAADPYAFPAAGSIVAPRLAPGARQAWEAPPTPPAFEITPEGWMRRVGG
jgi:hypothetical protein